MNGTDKYTITVLGGDKRQRAVVEKLSMRGHMIRTFALGSLCADIGEKCIDARQAILDSDIIILPLPATRDNIHLFCPLEGGDGRSCGDGILLYDLIGECYEQKYILGGMLPSLFSGIAEKCGFDVTDYYASEELQQKNALATAEGALMIAMQNTERTLRGSRFAVSGYGRIGKRLAEMLKVLDSEVIVMARSDEALSEAQAKGYDTFKLREDESDLYFDSVAEVCGGCDIIFNTVPSLIFGKSVFEKMKGKKPIFIELASAPGGFDSESAREYGIRTIYAPSLPGRYAPISAGEYIADTIISIMSEKGVFL